MNIFAEALKDHCGHTPADCKDGTCDPCFKSVIAKDSVELSEVDSIFVHLRGPATRMLPRGLSISRATGSSS
jgi:hypothetical protein